VYSAGVIVIFVFLWSLKTSIQHCNCKVCRRGERDYNVLI